MQVCSPPVGGVMAKFMKMCFLNFVILLELAAESFPHTGHSRAWRRAGDQDAEVSTLRLQG